MNAIHSDSVKKNFLYQSSYQLLSLVLPLITAPYISRVLGAAGTGVYSYASSILYYFMIAANLGITNYGNREIASNLNNKGNLSRSFWSIFFCHAFFSILSTIAYYAYVFAFVKEYRVVFLWQSIQMFATLFDITWFFSGIQIFKVTVLRNFVVRLLTVVSIFVFIKTSDDIWKYLAILAIGNFIGQISVWTQLRKYISFERVSVKSIIKHIIPMLVLFVPVIAISIYRYMDKIMIPYFSNMTELGLYENSEKIVSLPLTIITTVGVVMLPKMSALASNGNSIERDRYINYAMKYSLVMAFGIAGGLFGISDIFAPLFFGEEFRRSGELISLLAVTILFLTWSNSIRSQYLIPNKKDSAFIVAAFSGAGVNLLLNVFLISRLGAKGAVYATIAAEFVVAIIHTLYSYKELKFVTIIKSSFVLVVPAIIMGFFVRTIGLLLGEHYSTLVLQIVLGALLYLLCALCILIIQKDQYVCSIINRICKRTNKIG